MFKETARAKGAEAFKHSIYIGWHRLANNKASANKGLHFILEFCLLTFFGKPGN